MFLSFEKRFIFLHSRKTSGSAISVALAKQMNASDILLGCWADAIKLGVPLNRQAMLALESRWFEKYFFYCSNFLKNGQFIIYPNQINLMIKRYFSKHTSLKGAAHSTAGTIKEFVGNEFWEKSFKFTVVRNPWEHAVSDFYWRQCPQKGIDFKSFLQICMNTNEADPMSVRPPIISNWPIYTINEKVVCDFICRYENLQDDLKKVEDAIGLDIIKNLTPVKVSQKNKSTSIASFYDQENNGMIEKIYSREIEEFDYSCPF